MGIPADLILAEPSDMQAIVASDYPLGTFKGANADGLDPLMLAELHSLLTGQEYRELLTAYRPAAQASEKGPWLIQIPPEMIHRLADFPPQDHASLASRWAAGDRMSGQSVDGQWVEETLERLAFLAQTSAFEGKELFLVIYA